MGWFEDRKQAKQQEDAKKKAEMAKAGNLFSGQEKKADYSNDLADRLNTYGKLPSSESVLKQKEEANTVKGPRTAKEMLEELRNPNKNPNAKRDDDISQKNMAAVKDVTASFQNKNFNYKVQPIKQEKLTAQEKAAQEKAINEKLGSLENTIKNVGLVTNEEEYGPRRPRVQENLSSRDVDARTAGFRNVGFLTDVERTQQKAISSKEKTENDIEDLEKIDSMVSQFSNASFKTQNESNEGEDK